MPGELLMGVGEQTPGGGSAESTYSLSFDGSTGYVDVGTSPVLCPAALTMPPG